ncbi:hypothetical protein PAXRUDRAFT_175978, partial [Paxillus rubicundulus Ve08.2h10]
ILQHAKKVMDILQKYDPDDDHTFVFDNTTTHLKCANDALSACNMPRSCREWGVDAPMRDKSRKPVHGPDGKVIL